MKKVFKEDDKTQSTLFSESLDSNMRVLIYRIFVMRERNIPIQKVSRVFQVVFEFEFHYWARN